MNHKYPENLTEHQKIQYIQKKCMGLKTFSQHQVLLSKLMNQNTPYTALLLYHNVGTGKTIAAIAIAEGLKNYIRD